MTVGFLDVGIAEFTLPGESCSGDRYHLHQTADHALIGVIDGLGHGAEAAAAAEAACEQLAAADSQSVGQLLARCHEHLRGTRGAAMTLMNLDMKARRLEWVGVGNIMALLLHPQPSGKFSRTELYMRGGVVGVSIPATVASGVNMAPGDLVVAATDGVDIGFVEDIGRAEPPQQLAERLLERYRNGHDDALVVVARIHWGNP
jgi:serine phosphatase RsbU (regulator of sigma subunit)